MNNYLLSPGCSIERQTAAAVLNNSNNKKLGARAAPTHVQHTPGVVEISVNGGKGLLALTVTNSKQRFKERVLKI